MRRNKNEPLNITERVHSRISMLAAIVALVIICIVFNRIDYNMIRKPAQEASLSQEEGKEAGSDQEASGEEKEVLEETNQGQTKTARVVALGDNYVIGNALVSGINSKSFDHLYANIKADIQGADLAVITQDIPLTSSASGVSNSYPYVAPSTLGDAMVSAGFDVVGLATDNMAVAGSGYLNETYDYFTRDQGVTPVGLHASGSAPTYQLVTVNDIRIAFLNFAMPMYGATTNVSEVEDENGYYDEEEGVYYEYDEETGTYSPRAQTATGTSWEIDTFDVQKVTDAVNAAKANSDFVIFMAHWGKSEECYPCEYQKQWASYLMGLGVNVVLGTFPHVLNPYVTMQDSLGHASLVYYSLGNAVSNGNSLTTLLGGMADFTIQKSVANGVATVSVVNRDLVPLFTHYSYTNNEYTIYKLSQYTDALAENHSGKTLSGLDISVSSLNTKVDEILAMNVEPSTNTSLLAAIFDQYGNAYDEEWNELDNYSMSVSEYYASIGDGTEDSSEDYDYDDSE